MENDASLVKSTLAGNLDDFRKLVEKYQHDAEKWAFHRVKNLFDAEDIAQEAFVEAYFRLDTLRQPHKFGSWLRSIVSNTSVSWLRRRRPTVFFEEVNSVYGDESWLERYNRYEMPTPEELFEQKEQEEKLQMAVDALSPTHKRVITMFYFDSLSKTDRNKSNSNSLSKIKQSVGTGLSP